MCTRRLAPLALLVALLAACGETTCPEGYRVSHDECVDIDECTATNPEDRNECGPNATCTNTPGGYSCAFDHP